MSNYLRNKILHKINPVHIYCRLMEHSISKRKAEIICLGYERYFFKPLLIIFNLQSDIPYAIIDEEEHWFLK